MGVITTELHSCNNAPGEGWKPMRRRSRAQITIFSVAWIRKLRRKHEKYICHTEKVAMRAKKS
jgi:hypothetical protein